MEFVLVGHDETATGKDIVITQKDIRQIQLAKAALHAGCRVLMGCLGVEDIGSITIAGAFGMHIDKVSALNIGLFPWCDPKDISMVGNAAGHGAYLALIDRDKRKEADRMARSIIRHRSGINGKFSERIREGSCNAVQNLSRANGFYEKVSGLT